MSAFALILVAMQAVSQPPDNSPEAYRADALRTKALNDAAIARLAPSPTPMPPSPIASPPTPTAAELSLAAREREAIEAWRARRAECLAGTRSACD